MYCDSILLIDSFSRLWFDFRVETFIEHQDSCKAKSGREREAPKQSAINLNLMSVEPYQYSEPRIHTTADFELPLHEYGNNNNMMMTTSSHHHHHHNLEELELFPPSNSSKTFPRTQTPIDEDQEASLEALRLKFEAEEMMKVAMENKAMAEEKRKEAKHLIELANQEMAKARRIREQVWLADLTTSHLLTDCSTSRQIRCNSCRKQL